MSLVTGGGRDDAGPLGFDPEPAPPPQRDWGDDRDEPPSGGRTPIGASRYGWLLGLVAVLAVAYVTIDGARTEGPGPRGLPAGAALPPFAVPLATAAASGTCDEPDDPCDANVATETGQEGAGTRPACEVRGPAILNICELMERGPVVLAFLVARGGDCADALDPLEGLARRHPGVQVAVVGIRGDIDDLRAIASAHGWSFPVGWDRDGILAGFYGVAVCPHITFARWRGRAQSTSVGEIERAELDRRVSAAVTASRGQGWHP